MKAITTKFLGPTTTLGGRIRATDQDGNSYTCSADSVRCATPEQLHRYAAQQLIEEMEWHGTWHGGSTKRGMVWVSTGGQDNKITHGRKRGV